MESDAEFLLIPRRIAISRSFNTITNPSSLRLRFRRVYDCHSVEFMIAVLSSLRFRFSRVYGSDSIWLTIPRVRTLSQFNKFPGFSEDIPGLRNFFPRPVRTLDSDSVQFTIPIPSNFRFRIQRAHDCGFRPNKTSGY